MNKLTELVEAAKDTQNSGFYGDKPPTKMLAEIGTILELCALLEKAEEVLADTQKIMNMWPSSSLGIAVTEALIVIKQWKERT